MEIKISVLNTNLITNETVIKDFVIKDGEWETEDIELSTADGIEARAANESWNAFLFLWGGFREVLDLPEKLDLNDFENIFPIYTATDKKKRKRGYIYDLEEKEGIKTRIILIAPKDYLFSNL